MTFKTREPLHGWLDTGRLPWIGAGKILESAEPMIFSDGKVLVSWSGSTEGRVSTIPSESGRVLLYRLCRQLSFISWRSFTWMLAACLIWLAAGFMSIFQHTRLTAKCLALAMAGTFPSVFVYQVIVAPVVAAILLAIRVFWKLLEPGPSTMTNSPVVIVVSILGAILAFALVLGASVLGFYEGWRLGWAYGSGLQPLLTPSFVSTFV